MEIFAYHSLLRMPFGRYTFDQFRPILPKGTFVMRYYSTDTDFLAL